MSTPLRECVSPRLASKQKDDAYKDEHSFVLKNDITFQLYFEERKLILSLQKTLNKKDRRGRLKEKNGAHFFRSSEHCMIT